MNSRIHVATRKGLITLDRQATGWSVTGIQFEGENCNMVLSDPRNGHVYAALDHGHFGVKLHRSADEGKTWQEIGVPVYPAFTAADEQRQSRIGEVGARPDFSSLSEIWELVPGGADEPGVLWAGTIPGGLFRSQDGGDSWQLIQSLWDRDERWEWFGGGKDSPGIHSISVHPHDSQNVTVGISCGGVWVTEDGGTNWSLRATGMKADFVPPNQADDPNVQDPHRVVQCRSDPGVLWSQHHNGIFRTTDGGLQWEQVNDVTPSSFGFAVVVHPHDPQTAWFVPAVKDECRIPVDGRFVVTKTTDGGQSFRSITRGFQDEHCYDIVFRHGMDISACGELLVIGSSTGTLWVSEDGGESWQEITSHLPQIYCVRFAG